MNLDLDLDKYTTSVVFVYYAEAWEISKKGCKKGCEILLGKDGK